MSTTTIKDIARELNLSTSTVSRALRGSYEINAETKRLVTECARKLNYHPNPIALSLKGSASRALAVIVPQIANAFFSQAIDGIEAVANQRDYHVIIFQSQESYARELANLQQALARKVDGVLISLSNETKQADHLQHLLDQQVPLVLFDRVWPDLPVTQVVADNFGGAYAATEHLLSQGYRRIAHLAIPPWLSISQQRLAGYQAALDHHGVAFDPQLVRYGSFGPYEADPMVEQLLDLPEPPDAFFTASDRLAVGCLAALRKRGVQVPGQVGLVGFTNLPVAEWLSPALTQVVQPAQQIGRVAAERLISLIEDKHKPETETISIPTEMIIRESSANPVTAS